ncbi:trichothecene 3-o-acetyltransferase [Grosmannia clavigera kw1407]|uniref:Trichothecene 3-o-acetyltransferase n=1 Tax=Grosmannia clavigera (strain kw1407 / UAMH 11150) TaxID=655863 RepID=F0X6M9_GROCL|nr:trichothecene 3-o-acetyltransferase [Grosmannia clavigera kw1407]EFX06189.1 trichothecene 3-o-acetyltransferase [Grosmannia clavigera kw1407]
MLLEDKSKILSLTALERVGPKGYLRYVFPFELPENYDMAEVARVLQSGYNGLIQKIAVVGCEAVPDNTTKQAGVMMLQVLGEDEQQLVVKDLRAPGAFCMSYAELKAKNFPVSAFDGELLLRRSVWPSPGEELPISLVQANFVQGGLILTWCILHMVGDGNTFFTWTKVWAEECRRAGGDEIAKPLKLDPAIFSDRKLVMRSTGRHPGRLSDHPEYTLIPFTPQGAPPKMLSQDHRGQVFYFSPASLAALKAEASPVKASRAHRQKWISTNDALSALLWRTVMAVQSPLDSLEGDPVSVFNIAIDGRLRTDPPVHPNTLGCFLEYVAVSAPIRQILSSLSLADLAGMVRKAILRAGKHFTGDVVTIIDGLEDVDRLVPTAFLDVPGNHCVQSSWANFELYGLDWGSGLGMIQSVRCPEVGVINGLQVALPTLPDGGMEILVGVETEALDRLLHEPLWTRFAEAR